MNSTYAKAVGDGYQSYIGIYSDLTISGSSFTKNL